jgi:transposase
VIEPPDLKALDSAAKDALILALIDRINALIAENAQLRERIARLEARLGKPPRTPDNSSVPPSQGQKASGEILPRLGRKGHPGVFRALHPSPTRVREVMASQCRHCGTDVSGATQTAVHSYDRIEMPPIRPDVTRVVLYGGSCPCCRKRFKAEAPQGLEPGSPFGPNVKSLVVYLHCQQAIPLKRLAQTMSDLLGLKLSQGAIVNILHGAREAFAQAARVIRSRLLASTVLQSDETSMRVGKQTWWNWTFHHGDSACFLIEPSRGKDVIEAFLDGQRPDYWVSDRLAAQMGWAKKDHQVCLAHLIRDVQYAIDAGDSVFAPPLKALLQGACAIGRRREQLADATLRAHERKLDDKLNALLRLTPQGAEGRKLLDMVKTYRRHFFVFVTNRDLPATNNGSEQALRPCVVFRKITQCFRSQWSPKLYADVRSVLETARRRAVNQLLAIQITLAGQPLFDTG